MSEEYTHVGTVRRRSRNSRQRSPDSGERNGKARSTVNGNGHGPHINGDSAGNGHDRDEFERERWYDRTPHSENDEEPAPRRRPRPRKEPRLRPALPYAGRELDAEPPLFRFPFDPWRLYGAARRNLAWILAGGLLLAAVSFFLGAMLIDYKINLPLMRKTSNAVHQENAIPDSFAPREFSDATLYGFLKAPEVLKIVAQKAAADPVLAPLHVTAADLAGAVKVTPIPNPDYVVLSLKNLGSLHAMPALINLYANEAIAYTREIQQRESRIINGVLRKQLAEAEEKIAHVTEELSHYSDSGYIALDRENEQDYRQLQMDSDKLEAARNRFNFLNEQLKLQSTPNTRLQQAKDQLANLLSRGLTENHPDVIYKRHEIENLEKLQEGSKPVATVASTSPEMAIIKAERDTKQQEVRELEQSIAALKKRLESRGGKNVAYEIKQAEEKSLEKSRDILAGKVRESQLYVDNSLGYFGVDDPATMSNIAYKSRWIRVGLVAILGGLVGLLGTLALVLLTEALDTSLRTAEDVARVTRLPVLATLGDLRKMSAAAQVDWAFRTLTALKGKLSRNPDQSLVCGIISANHGEGRSTWVNLLVSAASQRGLRVLTVDTRPASEAPAAGIEPRKKAAEPVKAEAAKADSASSAKADAIPLPDQMAVEANVLTAPAKVAEQLDGPNPQPVVHIPLPGWVWSLERRQQWQDALDYWRDIDNLVIFVELPPACDPESILLAEHLPQLIWLTGSGMADSSETRKHLETLRDAHANIVGAVLNHAPPPFMNARIARWFMRSCAALLLAAGLSISSSAATKAPNELQSAGAPAVQTGDLGLSANGRHKRAQWQEHLTLGPGDIIDIHFFSNTVFTALSRTNVVIGPDGRINYLYASGIQAAGLTVEELRKKISDSLYPEFYKQPPTIVVVPVAFRSKKYYMLGKINVKGAFTLDRPLTLVEAVARAKGLETGLYQRNTVELADLGHSFVIRNGEKLPVDFEKLFLEGDLSQNALIEPNDYIYFASAGARDIYVLGEVMTPGPIGFVQNATVLTAITDRGGYTERAYKRRVLVIRGSLNEPETFVVDSGGVLDARNPDFKLQPKDIIYVAHRPWLKAEDLLDEAAGAFIEGAMTTWAGANVGPIITERLLPRVKIR